MGERSPRYRNYFRPYLSAKPTVGRFALGPPHNVQSRAKIKVPFTYYRIRSRLGLDYARDDEAKNRYAWFLYCPLARYYHFIKQERSARLAAGRGRPALPKRFYARQSIVVLKRYTLGRTRASAPTTLYQSLSLPLFNVISTEAPAKWRNPPRKSADTDTAALFSTLFVGVAYLPAGTPCRTSCTQDETSVSPTRVSLPSWIARRVL